MNRALRSLGFLVVFSLLPGTPAPADLVLMTWSHEVRAADTDAQDAERFSSISDVLPFTGTGLARLREIRTDGTFTTSFHGHQLTSLQQADHSLLQTTQTVGDELWSHAVSAFWLTSDMDLQVAVAGSLTFDLFGEDSAASISLEVLDGNQDPFYSTSVARSFPASPGTVELTDSLVPPTGTSYFVQVMSTLAVPAHRFAPPQSTASSDITLTVTAIPEPASLLLLAGGALLACSRRRGKSPPPSLA